MSNPKTQSDIDRIIDDIKVKGYSTVTQVLSHESCQEMINSLHESLEINQNYIVGGFSTTKSGFLSNAIARDHTTYKFLSSDFIIRLSNQYLGSARLKAHRLYFTRGRCSNFPWHTDNKVGSTTDNSKGIVCIIYLNDVEKGGISVIENAYIDSSESLPSSVQVKNLLRTNDTYSFRGKAGDAIFFDQALVHKAARDFFVFDTINALFFQVVDKNGKVEPLLLRASQVPEETSQIYKFFSIGETEQLSFAQPKTKSRFYPPNLLFKKLPGIIMTYLTQTLRIYLRFTRNLFR